MFTRQLSSVAVSCVLPSALSFTSCSTSRCFLASLARGLQGALSCLMSTATTPAPVVASDPGLLLYVQLLEVGTAVQIVVAIFAVWTVGISLLHLTVAVGWRLYYGRGCRDICLCYLPGAQDDGGGLAGVL